MTSRDFCYWLQGYLEIAGSDKDVGLTPQQLHIVGKHLAMVFKHEIDPSFPKEQQQVLNEVHSPAPLPSRPTVYRC